MENPKLCGLVLPVPMVGTIWVMRAILQSLSQIGKT